MKNKYIVTIEVETSMEKKEILFSNCLGMDTGETTIAGMLSLTKIPTINKSQKLKIKALHNTLKRHIKELVRDELKDN